MNGQDIGRFFRSAQFSQEKIVFSIAVVMFVVFSATLQGFLTTGNVISLVQSVSILGVLSIGMALTIFGRGIDLSIVSNMAISVAWVLYLANQHVSLPAALLCGLGLNLAIGLLNGVLIAYVEIPAIFATLAMGTAVYGFGHSILVNSDVIFLPNADPWFKALGGGSVLGIPSPVLWLIALCAVVFLFLRFTRPGRFIFGMGDNPLAARIAGIPVRPMIVLQYLISSLIGFLAGIITATLVNSMNTRVANSTLVYDVILVVAIGGVGLSGGKGSVRNVIVGTLLIGTLFNGMTILDVPYTLQNIVKSVILLIAIVTDSLLNPRDEQTSQQGDI
ncbi:MAG TPA: ABC transporter permease [Magnetospirillaceae bacterium]|jgi:ribose transport system permease protein